MAEYRTAIRGSNGSERTRIESQESAVKRLIFVPILDAHQFQGLIEVYRTHSLVALVGESSYQRSRHGYGSEELFLKAVARGTADRYTFHSLQEATVFAKEKLETWNRLGRAIERKLREIYG